MGKRLCWLSWYDSSGRVMTKSWGVLDPLSRSLKTEEANLFQEPLPGPRSGGSRKMPCKLPNFGVICDTYFPLLLAAAPLKPDSARTIACARASFSAAFSGGPIEATVRDLCTGCA